MYLIICFFLFLYFISPIKAWVDGNQISTAWNTQYSVSNFRQIESKSNFALSNHYSSGLYEFSAPLGVSLDHHGNMYVVDSNNNRVLYYPFGLPYPTRVYGQLGDFLTGSGNKGGISADSLNFPSA